MTEDFLYYLWKYKLIEPFQSLTSGDSLEIISPGVHNKDSGPDFFNARIKIGDTQWAGNVEMHTRSSMWIQHGHHKDLAYDNVILHVVFQNDKNICRKNGETIPTLEIQGKVDPALLSVYQQLMLNKNWVPCSHLISYASRFVIHNWLDRVIAQRLERKAVEIREKLVYHKNNWNESFYLSLARNFGFSINAIPFELVARSLPLNILAKHKNSLFQIEALLFGQAGMLSVARRSLYFSELKKEYTFLTGKYQLYPIDIHLWRFMRMRPTNFPTIRIAQFAALIHHSSFLFSRILEVETYGQIEDLFDVNASGFWDSHYTFSTRSKKVTKKLGRQGIQLLVINTIIPYLYAYGKIKNMDEYCERALRFMEQLPGENNAVIRHWKKYGLPARTAYHTQALLELKGQFCQRKLCLECGIGNFILNACIE